MLNTQRIQRFTLCSALLLTLGLSTPAAKAQLIASEPNVTTKGFAELIDQSTLYLPVPLHGVMGSDCPPEAVHEALKFAAEHPHIEHAVFMIDSDAGWPLENEHIGVFSADLEISAVVRVAIEAAIFPTFFADHIFMTDTALVGGFPLHSITLPGSEEVTAKQVGIFSSMLASAAQSRGHDPAIAYAMIDKKKRLYAWEEDGQITLSNTKQEDSKNLSNYREIRELVYDDTLILDQQDAIEIGFAKAIDSFDHEVVGGYLGHDHWTPANRFARVACQIGEVVSELEPLRDQIRELDNQLRDVRNDQRRDNSEVKGYRQFKRNLDKAVRTIDMINASLEKVYETHPERHLYFAGPNGETIVEDADKWSQDLNACKLELGRASSMVKGFTKDFRTLGGDAEFLYEINQTMDEIMQHLRGIEKHGNATYWEMYAKPDLPDDIYG